MIHFSKYELILSELCNLFSIWEVQYENQFGLPKDYVISIVDRIICDFCIEGNNLEVPSLIPGEFTLESHSITSIYKILLKVYEINSSSIFNEIKQELKFYLERKYSNRLFKHVGIHSHHYIQFLNDPNVKLLIFTRSNNDGDFEAWIIEDIRFENDILNELL